MKTTTTERPRDLEAYVWTLARRMSGPVEADDLFQESFLMILTYEGRYDPGRGSARTWVRFMIREAYTRLTRKARVIATAEAGRAAIDGAAGDLPEPFDRRVPDPAAAAEWADQVAALGSAVAALPRSDRRLLGRRFGVGRRSGEPVDVRGHRAGYRLDQIPATRRQLDRALGRLRDRLGAAA